MLLSRFQNQSENRLKNFGPGLSKSFVLLRCLHYTFSTMSIAITEVTKSLAGVILADVRQKFVSIMSTALATTPNGAQLQGVITPWIDAACQQCGGGVCALTVPIAGGAPPAQAFPPSQNTMQFGLGQQMQPIGSFGQVGGMQAMAAASTGGGGALPKDCAATLAEVGLCRVPRQQYPTGPPPGARCGYEQEKKGYGKCFCTKEAKAAGESGLWCCTGHKGRKDADGRAPKKTSGATSGGRIAAAQHINGIHTPMGAPPTFGNNPSMATNMANMMGQTAGFNNPLAGGLSNPMQSSQLMNNTQAGLGQIAQVPVQPAGFGGFNLSNAMSQPGPTAVAVNPLLGAAPQASSPLGQVATFQIPASEFRDANDATSDEENSDDEDGGDGEPESAPIQTVDPNALQAAMAAYTAPVTVAAPTPNPMMQMPAAQSPLLSAMAAATASAQPQPTNVNSLLSAMAAAQPAKQ